MRFDHLMSFFNACDKTKISFKRHHFVVLKWTSLKNKDSWWIIRQQQPTALSCFESLQIARSETVKSWLKDWWWKDWRIFSKFLRSSKVFHALRSQRLVHFLTFEHPSNASIFEPGLYIAIKKLLRYIEDTWYFNDNIATNSRHTKITSRQYVFALHFVLDDLLILVLSLMSHLYGPVVIMNDLEPVVWTWFMSLWLCRNTDENNLSPSFYFETLGWCRRRLKKVLST